MRYSTTTAAFVASALMLALAPQAAQAGVTAFGTGTCGGDVGLDVPCIRKNPPGRLALMMLIYND